ncbi:MAG: ATP-binding protein [Spirochaetales bacterium]|jgi:predicted kinase|nr:ATP-binding protein [Spirochaetales bacterium]
MAKKLIIVCGFSFAGKSTLADAICSKLKYVQVDVDVTKVELFGPSIGDEDISGEEWNRIYRETDLKIEECLKNSVGVIDASRNFRKQERDNARHIAQQLGAGMIVVHVDTPESVVRQRWEENRITRTRRVISDKEFQDTISAMEPPMDEENPIVFHHDEDSKQWIAQLAEYLCR